MAVLKRSLSLFDAIMINLGAIIGAGIFVIIGIAAGKAGPYLPVAILLSGAIAAFTGLSFSEIAREVAKEGGVYEYAKDTLNRFAGFIGGMAWIFSNIIAISAVSMSTGGYINSLFGINAPVIYFALSTIFIFAIVNMLGIKNSAKTIAMLVIVNVTVLVIFIVSGMFRFNPSHFYAVAPFGFGGILEATAIIFFAFTGFSRITTVSDEVDDPKRTIPKAIVLSIIISAIIYTLVAVVAIGDVPYMALAGSSAPLSVAEANINNYILDAIIAIGGITATAGVTLTGILGASRVLFAMGRDRELPAKLSKIDRFSTPQYAIIVTSIISAAFVVLVSFNTIVEASNAAALFAYLVINLAALKLYIKKKGISLVHIKRNLIERDYFAVIPILGILTTLLVIFYLGIASLSILAVIIIASSIYYFAAEFMRKKHTLPKAKATARHSFVRLFGRSRAE
ncbi:MAG: amino acid permease [Candidatus Micrarchaeaceae archaeon]